MNAGAYGMEMKDIIFSTKYMDEDGNVKEINNNGNYFADECINMLSTELKKK